MAMGVCAQEYEIGVINDVREYSRTPSIFIFKSGVCGFKLQQCGIAIGEAVIHLAGGVLVNGSCHGTAYRCLERMPCRTQPLNGQAEAALPDNDPAILDLNRFRAQIGGKAVLFSVEQNDTNNPGKVKLTQGNIRSRQHQCALRETALGPNIFFGERVPPVTFCIAYGIVKHIGNTIDPDFSVYPVAHTVNAMPALHEGNALKRSHNVIANRRKITKANSPLGVEAGGVNV